MSPTKAKKEDKLSLAAQKRTVTGKQVRKLRREGLIPANIYGPGFDSQAVSVTQKEFLHTFKTAHETGVVHLVVDKDTYPTLIRNVQKHPVSRDIIHVDFRKIDLTKKIEAQVPVVTTGKSIAVDAKGGVLLTQLHELTVEALPNDIPDTIEIDISVLQEIGDEIKVSDIKIEKGYVIKDEPEKVILSVTAHKEESIEPETSAVETEVITEKAETSEETESGEAPKEEKKDAEA